MDWQKVLINGLAFVIVAFGLYWVFSGGPKVSDYGLINSYETCLKAGYKVTPGQPNRCSLPNGEIYFESKPWAQVCSKDSECGSGGVCLGGQCQKFRPDNSCVRDSDCRLIDQTLKYDCCQAGSCQPKDYSQDRWVAVNAAKFDSLKAQACQSQACGIIPQCIARPENQAYEARCVGGTCEKLPVRQ